MSESTTLSSRNQQPNPETSDRNWDEGGAQKLERQLFFALIGGMLLLVAWIGRFAFGFDQQVADVAATCGAIILVIPLARGAIREILSGTPSSDALASLAVIAAIAVGEYLAAGFLAFFLWIAELVLSRTAWGAQRAIRELVELTPDMARIVDADGTEQETGLRNVTIGSVVRVRPGENLPVDGRIIDGRTDINQASLTGEAIPIEATKGTEVYAGTTNLTGQVDIEVTAIAGETTIGKVEQLIREAESTKGRKQELIEKLASYYVPVVLMVALAVGFFTANGTDPAAREAAAVRAITVLVVTCPGALLIAYPTAMVAAFAAAARLGIMIKQTRTLEAASRIDTVVLDKTGTLTTGKFAVSRLAPAEGVDGALLLQRAADAEQSSNHPLARSILETAERARITPGALNGYSEVHGRGVKAETGQGVVYAGRPDWLVDMNPGIRDKVAQVEEKIEGMSGVHVMMDDQYLGAVGLEDALRSNAVEAITSLREAGVRRVCIFTGDRLSVAKRVGQTVGVDSIEAECLPEEKHEELKYLISKGHRTLVVGDGINDGPILASADVGVAMGLTGSDIATNSAGVALMNDDLRHLPFLLDLARRGRGIIAQNIAASLVLAVVGLALAATGQIDIYVTPFYQAVAYVFVIANSLRLVRFGEDFAEEEQRRVAEEAARKARPRRRSREQESSAAAPAT